MSKLHAELNSFNYSRFALGRRKTHETFVELTGHGTFWMQPMTGCAAASFFFLRVSVCDTDVFRDCVFL